MDTLFVEEVAASLVREFLNRKGLKKTCVIMDQERPRSDLSINSRNDLRKVLHLEFLYRENKAKENPLKTNLELMTRYFLDHSGKTDNNLTQETPIPALSVPKKINKLPLRCSETKLVNIYDLSDEDAGWRTSLTETGKARHDNLDGDVLGHLVSSKRPHHKSKPVHLVAGESPALVSAWERMDKLHSSESSVDIKRTGEKTRPKSGLIVRGMMAGPVASSTQDPLWKRSLRRSPAPSSKTHSQEEESEKVPELSTHTPASAASQNNSASSRGSVSRSPRSPPSEPSVEKCKATPSSPPQTPHAGLSHWDKTRPRGLSEDSPAENGPVGPMEEEKSPMRSYLPGGFSRVTQERLQRAFKRQSRQPPLLRKNQPLASDKVDDDLGALQLEDVDDTSIKEEVILSPAPSVLKLQVASKPIDLSVAKEIKTLLFGSCFCCFNEEWKLQSFSFSDTASLKYGIVQNKGGPCGVLAAVQGCVLQKLLFEGESGARCARQLQPSDTHRTRCLTLAIADILWRAGGRQRAVVALSSGSEQFSPTGKYKADGVLETLTLHSLTCYEELVTFLQYSIHQFQAGPYGCILLTLSAILSRSLELVRQDFDVPTTHLIGAHGYCTQELVNLLLTGRAVSNVFNDVVELDSGNGNITLLRGITARSDIGFLSLFEHYNVCQGCHNKMPQTGWPKQQKFILLQFWMP
uniref:probable ubiquitin carboxyl-terminal hydrolase MINDY-4 isoform X3 n=1 Tax=Ictidomys tridecemlineatus TaxID=43179 RepID=UPI001A9DB089|nr:probable ubiquitin carboxyl-terminal hydrolase MINDY-4 isoform X3 [Ictidomys tridecemlineatus]